jgi:hypothetical protein
MISRATPCRREDPRLWDLDYLTETDPARVTIAYNHCRACPALTWCKGLTYEQVLAKQPPKQLIQAGMVWNAAGEKTSLEGFFVTAARQRSKAANREQREAS